MGNPNRETTPSDEDLLDLLQLARRQHDSFGLGTEPGDPLIPALERLRAAGKVYSRRVDETETWWQANRA